jgi:feruloyl esterase
MWMRRRLVACLAALLCASFRGVETFQAPAPADSTIAESDCSASKLGDAIPASAIGEPVSGVTLKPPVWVAAAGQTPAHCRVDGALAPMSADAPPINFRVLLPAAWTHRAMQLGGGGMNGVIPNLAGGGPDGSMLARGMATYASDSGHQAGPGVSQAWALSDEAIKNLGYMQLKKTHDAAMVIVERMYGQRPRYSYFVGTSQGGREALTVAQRYPADYDGVAANVPIVSFSSLMLAPEWIRIQEKPAANWVTPAKVNAIRGEFMRQCDGLDGLVDGVMNNYMACRAIFDVSQGAPGRHPWSAVRCPDTGDRTAGTNPDACLTDGQIATLQVVYSRYRFASPLANGVRTFGMWVPNTDPSGSGLILDARVKGQEGAADNAPVHSHLGALGVTGFLMRDLSANPLDYVEGGALDARRVQLSAWLDSTNPDLTAFAQRGGKLIAAIGTNDTLASPGAQLDYYQSVVDRMGRPAVDRFARLFVIPQVNHGLRGTSYAVDGRDGANPAVPVPSTFDRVGLLMDWVEKNAAPGAVTVTAADTSRPLCAYPAYPKYTGGPAGAAASYTCAQP